MVVQICCAVDSSYFFRELKKLTNEPIIGYFYDPNIHPYSEFLLRFMEVKRDCKKLGIKVYAGEYDFNDWLNGAKGLENEPEKGKRCQYCFDFRMSETAEFAKKIGENKISTTLLMSPKKSHLQLVDSLKKICDEQNLEFIAPDFRKNGGTNAQFALARDLKVYHQNYCGCIYALCAQRKESEIFELMSPVNRQILPNSIEDKIRLYRKISKLEKKGAKFEILRDKFINYRLLSFVIKFDGIAQNSVVLFNSHFKLNFVKFMIPDKCHKFFSDKEQIKILNFKEFCKISNVKFKNFDEFAACPLSVKKELKIRKKIVGAGSFSPIIIVDKIPRAKCEISANSKIYIDIREILVRIR